MTEQEFLALKPRERDVLVAEKVMGVDLTEVPEHSWDVLPSEQWEEYGSTSVCSRCLDLSGWEDIEFLRERPGGPCARQPVHYTTLIAPAWQVVEKMDGFQLDLNSFNPKYGKPAWNAMATYYEPEGFGSAYADTATLAICLAALRVVGVVE